LEVVGRYYFSTPGVELPAIPGWYIICDHEQTPLYVGEATNLQNRLNSNDGSRDNFANPERSQDPARNFIKRFSSSGVLSSLCVIVIRETSICAEMGIAGPLSDIDRGNIEKVLGLFRERVCEVGR
jgi:hypothetical protein